MYLNILISIFLILTTHASDHRVRIPLHIENKSWKEQTRLSGSVLYRDQTDQEISFILKGISKEQPTITMSTLIPYKKISLINLFLVYEDGEDDPHWDAKTLLASLSFKPDLPILRQISFELINRDIIPKPIYNLPPLFDANIKK
jgi:hypothetical protein